MKRYPMRYLGRANGYPTTSYTQGGVSVTSTSSEVLAANWQRFHVRLENQGLASIFVRLDGTTATADKDSTEILPGRAWWAYTIPGSAITAITTGTQSMHVEWGGAPSPPVFVVASGVQVVVGGVQVVT